MSMPYNPLDLAGDWKFRQEYELNDQELLAECMKEYCRVLEHQWRLPANKALRKARKRHLAKIRIETSAIILAQ